MKKHLSLLLLLIAVAASAQNLVPNPSFEDTVSCPDFSGQVWRAQGWYIAQNTPDYFNACCSGQLAPVSVPCNTFSCRYAATGVAYCGFWTYCLYPLPEYYEKIGIQLSSSLTVGTRYYVSMKVSSVSSRNQGSNGAMNKLGMLFSTYQKLFQPDQPNNNYCQFWSDSIVTDTLGWVTLNGSFIADSNYNFLTVGNFFDNAHADTIRYWYNGNHELCTYYYVDDICVTTDSLGCSFSTGIQDPLNYFCSIGPNPVSDQITIQCKLRAPSEVTMVNAFGDLVYISSVSQPISEIKVRGLPNGLYLLRIEQAQNSFSQMISIVH